MGRNTAKQTTVQKSRQAHYKRIRTAEQTTKGVKQTAKSTGSKAIKTAQKGTVKTAETSVRVYTIEGNASDSCMECSYPIGYYEILGYGAPAY